MFHHVKHPVIKQDTYMKQQKGRSKSLFLNAKSTILACEDLCFLRYLHSICFLYILFVASIRSQEAGTPR
jgi:hypothetical protein